ncbi:response regulator [Pseudomonas sp. NW5]|uniref:response regulator n=1 Tax=Pseudomonas sp. NW5 TaxID=2934934 RepID=UPI002021E680|nr:response regulator [Pseudomonas sp. NW5]MCL7462645.1 response regulator [Pseudomonas sp. NW5]
MTLNKKYPATILVVTDDQADAVIVQNQLRPEFNRVLLALDSERQVANFDQHLPQVLVLAFKDLDSAEQFYLKLYRQSREIHQHPHRTIVLCSKDEVQDAYERCSKGVFDDYVLFWPMAYDPMRLCMSTLTAVRELQARQQAGQPIARLQVLGSESPALRTEPASPQPAAEPAAPETLVRPQILLVDDDEFVHKIVARQLDAARYELITAADATEALRILRNLTPDLVLLDIVMPGVDGLEALRRFRSMPALAKVPFVMLTGKSEEQVVVESLKLGASDFIAKPFDRATLLAKVARFAPLPGAATS